MKTGFSFKGKHSRDFGITAATKSRPILPEMNRVTFAPDAYDGLIDLSAYNELGRATYAERVFMISISVTADDIFKLQNSMTKLASWLTGTGELIFDDIPAVAWDASVVSAVDYMPERAGRKAVLSVTFNVKPFSHALFCAGNIPIGSAIPIGTAVPIGLDGMLTAELTESSSVVLNAYNIGSVPVKPRITIVWGTPEGYGPAVEITCRNRSISFNFGAYVKEFVVDMAAGRLTADGTAKPPRGGEFFELMPGANEVTVKAFSGAAVSIAYVPQFLYSWEVG